MNKTAFQTPEWVCEIMAGLIEFDPVFILEPTPGAGNLVRTLKKRFPDACIDAPDDLYKFRQNNHAGYHYIVANPPFSPMDLGYKMLDAFFNIADDIIILLPWLSLINSERRTKKYIEKGLKKIVHLPRKAFPGSRVQTCILVFQKGYHGDIIFEDAYRQVTRPCIRNAGHQTVGA